MVSLRTGELGKRIIVRSNLVILLDDAYAGFIDLYTKHRVEIVTSIPDYHDDKADRQRGSGVFFRIIQSYEAFE